MADRTKPARRREREYPSDATIGADGTVTRHGRWGPVQAWWWRLAGWKHGAIKLGALTCTAAVAWGMLLHRAAAERMLAVITGALTGAGLIRLVIWRGQRGEYRAAIRPRPS